VDNLITGENSVVGATNLYGEAKRIFHIPDDKAHIQSTNVLGHIWDAKSDTIFLKSNTGTSSISSDIPTKRSILKEVAGIFDPLGLFSPIVVRGKLLLQELWKEHLDWDDKIQVGILPKWFSVQSELKNITEHKVPRSILINTENKIDEVKFRLLCFCDASARAYAAAVYLHQISGNNSKVDLIFSKTRLAPLKGMTIPRLELMAVLIGTRCVKYVQRELNVPILEMFIWTDSQCVLKWIKSTKDLSVFVKNRITEIKAHDDITFRYVDTDSATRGTSFQKLQRNSLWWHGPMWLKNYPCTWTDCKTKEGKCATENYMSELRKPTRQTTCVTQSVCDLSPELTPFGISVEKYSSFIKLIRITAWMLRFVESLKGKRSDNSF